MQDRPIGRDTTIRRRASGITLAHFREAAGLSTQELADMLGMSASTLYRNEAGITSPTRRNLRAIQDALGVGPDEWAEMHAAVAQGERLPSDVVIVKTRCTHCGHFTVVDQGALREAGYIVWKPSLPPRWPMRGPGADTSDRVVDRFLKQPREQFPETNND